MSYRKRKQRRHSHNGRGRVVLVVIAGILSSIVIGALAAVGYVIAIANSAPDISKLKPIDKGATSIIYAADGSRLGYVQSDTIRTPISWANMPPVLRQATVAIEDRRFYQHGGVDLAGIARAAIKDVTTGKPLQGGSTITQQLVRNLYIKDPKRDLKRKIREAKMADDLEKLHSKQWILREYLNDVPYGTVDGQTAVGIEAAARIFFSRHARDLTLDEAAMLAGLPQAPSQFNPLREPGLALQRRNEVLGAMVKSHFISQDEAATAMEKPLGLRRSNVYTRRREPYVFDYVQDQLIQHYGVNVFRRGGLRVYTTVDPKLQEQGRQAIAGQLNQPGDPSAAVVSIDPHTGYAQLDLDVGPKNVARTARLLGIRTHLDGIPSEGLGGLRLGVSPLEMASAYATLAAGGMYSEPRASRKVVFPDGKVDELGKPLRKRVITDGQAYAVTKILQMNVQRGTGTAANFGCPAAGKTGTTDNYNDAWFVGYTPSMATAVWVGYPTALKEMRSVHGIQVAGGTFPAQIWHD